MNRIKLLIFCAALMLPACLRAQDDVVTSLARTKVTAGIKVGVNLSKLNGENWDNGYKTNLLGGAYLGVHGDRFGLQLEALFSQSSYTTGTGFGDIYHQYLNNVSDSAKHGTFRVSYLNIPLLAELRLLKHAWFQVGPQYSGVVGTKDVDMLYKDAKGLFSSGTVSGVLGLWFDLPLHLNFGARYVFDLSHANDNSVSQTWKQHDVQIHLGIGF